jgi:NAD(P)-dependent dehydrogenase (short-subunit alcohol dehydrogenase family)
MKIAVTGSSKLANCIQGNKIRVEFGADWSQYDVFVNNAHVEWEQCRLLEEVYEVWKDDETKTIVNISSRAHQPNISKGYKYAAQKAALNHMATNLNYNSDAKCRIATINCGLLESSMHSSISYERAGEWVDWVIKNSDITEITIENPANYIQIQNEKEIARSLGLKS